MESGNKVIQNIQKAARAVLRKKCIVIQGNLRKQEKSQKKKERISNLIPKKSKKGRMNKSQNQQKNEIIKVRAEINEIESEKKQKRSMKIRAGSSKDKQTHKKVAGS